METQSQTSFATYLPSSHLASRAFSEQPTRLNRMYRSLSSGQFCSSYAAKKAPRQISTRVPIIARVAIVGTVPESFPNAILAPGFESSDISLEVARVQHKSYCSALSSTSISSLIQLPVNPRYPDSIFVEDPVVVISEKTAFMAKAGHVSREGEGNALQSHLEQLGLRIAKNPDVRLDGGDVLKMNEFILVGITKRTDADSVSALQRVVDEDFYSNPFLETCPRVIGVPVEQGLHLKSHISWLGACESHSAGCIVAPDTRPGRDLIDRVAKSTERDWEVIWIDENEAHAANVLYVPPALSDALGSVGHVLVQETCPMAVNVIREYLENCKSCLAKTVVIPVDVSEFAKANGSLTCMSIIV